MKRWQMFPRAKQMSVADVDHARRLQWLATIVAVEAPERSNAGRAYISYQVIGEIRAELEAIGFDWRGAVRQRKQLEAENKAAWLAERNRKAGQ